VGGAPTRVFMQQATFVTYLGCLWLKSYIGQTDIFRTKCC